MSKLKYFNKFYIDKEKDVVVELYKDLAVEDELIYIIRTPYHKSGNLITNLAKLCDLDVSEDENTLKVIKGKIPASINGDGETVYIFRLAGMKIANIYEDKIEVKAKMPAITKTLMSQTKDYEYDIKHTLVKSYIFKKSKFKTDLHTHMNANLTPDVLISLGISHQLRYPLYYIKKLNLKLTDSQKAKIYEQRIPVEQEYEDCGLEGKYLIRKIDDNTFINFADLILNNLKDADYNIGKIRASLSLLKDGQSVFTNLEKVYIYRYVFCKGIVSNDLIKLSKSKIEKIPEKDIIKYVLRMLDDKKKNSPYKNNNIRQDKLLWIAREYQRQGIKYAEITDTDLVKVGEGSIKVLEDIHGVMPQIEKETGVKLRFLCGIRRIALTAGNPNNGVGSNYLRECLEVIKAVSKSPYVVGSDFIGEEINSIMDLKPMVKELVQFAISEDNGFTVRIHAGENDCLRDNVAESIKCIKDSLKPGQKIPKFRLGHGVYTADLNSKEGQELMQEMRDTGAILEFQLTSNVRLNNLTDFSRHPLKTYLDNGVNCVQGTDGCGFYGSDTFDEQLALHNLMGLDDNDFMKMRKVEDKIIEEANKNFEIKMNRFKLFIYGKTLRTAILEEEFNNLEEAEELKNTSLKIDNKVSSYNELKSKIKSLPDAKVPIIIAGGSFNAKNKETQIDENGKLMIRNLVNSLDDDKVYFVIGHKVTGFEKELIESAKASNKKFEIDAIVPKEISVEDKDKLLSENNINGIRISTESEEMGIYKSFNYEIFERRNSIVFAFDGNSPVSNLVQEAKNGKGKAKIFVNSNVESLKDKAKSLGGYVKEFNLNSTSCEDIINNFPELKK